MVIERDWRQTAGRWLPVLLWMGAIYFMSNQPKSDILSFGLLDGLIKKAGHFVAYALLAWLSWRGTKGWQRPYLWAFVITAVYAASDEFHQTFIPSRHGTLLDVLIDSVGGLTALALLRRRSRK